MMAMATTITIEEEELIGGGKCASADRDFNDLAAMT